MCISYQKLKAAWEALADEQAKDAIREEFHIGLFKEVESWDEAGRDQLCAALRKAGAPF